MNMFSAILLGYKLDFLLDENSFNNLTKSRIIEVIEDVKNCNTYVGVCFSEQNNEGGEEIAIDFKIFHDAKDAVLAAVAKSPEMSNWVRTSKEDMKLWHINLEC